MSWIWKDQALVGTVIGLMLAGITPFDDGFAAVEVPGDVEEVVPVFVVVDPVVEVEEVPEVEVEPPVVLTPVTPEGVVVPVLVAA